MLSVVFEKFGEPAEVLSIKEAEMPEPGPGQALIRMKARPINPSDLYTVRGLYGMLPKLPAVPGYEGMGVVEKLGDGAGPFKVGQRVIPFGVVGTWQEYVIASLMQMVPVPDPVSDASAAQFVVNPLTAWIMISEELSVKPGEWLLQTAAGSTLGRVVLQLARLRGFKTINIVRRRNQVEELKQLGADEVIATEDENIVERVMSITEGKGVSYAIDAVGGKTGADVERSLANRGVMIVYGLLSLEPTPIDVRHMIFRSSTVRGFWLSEWFKSADPQKQQSIAMELMMLMAKGDVAPPVEAEYELKDVLKAVKHSEEPGRSGKVLLVG